MKYYTYRLVVAIDDDDPTSNEAMKDWIVSQVENHDTPYIRVDSLIDEF